MRPSLASSMCVMGTERTHYQILGVSAEASADEIRRAYRARMRAVHPDVNTNVTDESQRITEINLAWKTLSSPQSRRAYDSSVLTTTNTSVSSGARSACCRGPLRPCRRGLTAEDQSNQLGGTDISLIIPIAWLADLQVVPIQGGVPKRCLSSDARIG
jgi:curved DNA-binding protein CbpA